MTDVWLETLSVEECTQRLRAANVGRIAVIHDGGPIVLPVNYKLVEASGGALSGIDVHKIAGMTSAIPIRWFQWPQPPPTIQT